MGCLDGNCAGQICKPDLISPHMPPRRSGWKLVGYPEFVPELFRAKYGANPTWNGNTPDQVMQNITFVLKTNGVKIELAMLCQWANEQWCAADPDRCRVARSKDSKLAAQRSYALVGETMQWATPFWQVWNVGVSDTNRENLYARPTMEGFIETALHLVNGQNGCPKCAKHFSELLLAYPPAKINTWVQARVWLWRVHNESRDSKRVVPYYEIAKIYGWDLLEDAEVLRIIEEELRA
jgi:hypothetical protein